MPPMLVEPLPMLTVPPAVGFAQGCSMVARLRLLRVELFTGAAILTSAMVLEVPEQAMNNDPGLLLPGLYPNARPPYSMFWLAGNRKAPRYWRLLNCTRSAAWLSVHP